MTSDSGRWLDRFRASLARGFADSSRRSFALSSGVVPTVFLIDEFYGHRSYCTSMLDHLAASLGKRGIRVEASDTIAAIASKVAPEDLVISHQVPPVEGQLPDSQVFGRLKTPRNVGLQLLGQAGIDVVRWATPANQSELQGLFEKWGTNTILLKRADTYRATRHLGDQGDRD